MQFLNFQLWHQTTVPSYSGTSVCRAQAISGCPQTATIYGLSGHNRVGGGRRLLAMLTVRWRPRARHHQRSRSCFVWSTSRRCGARAHWRMWRWLQCHAHIHSTLDVFSYGLPCTAPAQSSMEQKLPIDKLNGPVFTAISKWLKTEDL
jgi:hypothetical protein